MELSVGGVVVKRLDCRAIDQIPLLSEFQKEGWRKRIDDPLPPADGQDARQRLKYAIHALNTGQHTIQFHGDGTGRGIRWQFVNERTRRNGRKIK